MTAIFAIDIKHLSKVFKSNYSMIFLWLLGMVVRVGINGFGRIGRVIFRTCVQSKDLEVSAINDPAVDIEYICYLIKFDSTHGKFKVDVSYSADSEICIDDKKIKVFSEKLPSNIPWYSAAVQYVVEASGMFTNFEKASGHLASEGVQRVIVTAPTIDVPMLILGVNNEQINAEQKVISSASSTLYCLAPIVKILEDNYGIAEGFITSIHAMTPSLKPLDGLCLKGKHWRDHRSIHQNIIPAATGACRALGKVIPSVRDKLTGLAFRVPIVNVSVLDITVRLNKNTTIQDIIKRVAAESVSKMKNIIKISRDQEVSSDFMGDESSCIFDINSSLQLNPKFFKLICWYENEYSYACRVLDSIKYSEEICKLQLITKIPFGSIISTDHKKPIPDFNKEYTIAKCLIRNNSKILLRTPEETGLDAKSLERQITFERPSLYQNSESYQLALCKTKQSNDIFNGCNDEVQSKALVKENKNLSFQNFVSLKPSYVESNNFQKTKERLEEVKQEFSKMVNITENLVMKSNKSKLNILEEEIENNVGKKDTKQEICNTRFTLPIVSKSIPTSRVFQTSFSKLCKDVFKTHKKENSNTVMIKNSSNLDDTPKLDYKRLNQHMESKSTEICVNSKIIDSKLLAKCQSESQDSEKKKENVNLLKANDGLVNLQSLRLENTICNLEKTLCATRVGNKNIKPKVTVSVGLTDLGSSNLEMVTTISKHNIKCYDVKNNSDIILVNKDNKNPNKSDLNSKELTVEYIKPESSEPEKNNMNNRTEIRKKIIQGIIKILTADAIEDKTHNPSLVNTNTTRSDRVVNNTADIYDKLDSASSTDSENSFEINERKSQVIDVTDLNSSAEDLARLDKICRIIEISDEMSDKLFSALGNNDKNIKKKKWSFKDLCERLKLDEFCNDVFG